MSITEWQNQQDWKDLEETRRWKGLETIRPPDGLYRVRKSFFVFQKKKKLDFGLGETYVLDTSFADKWVLSKHLEIITGGFPSHLWHGGVHYLILINITESIAVDDFSAMVRDEAGTIKGLTKGYLPYRILRPCAIWEGDASDTSPYNEATDIAYYPQHVIVMLHPWEADMYCRKLRKPVLELVVESHAELLGVISSYNKSLYQMFVKGAWTVDEKNIEKIDEGRVRLYKDGDKMGIMTDISDERDFIDKISRAFSQMIETGMQDNDWYFQFVHWLPCIIDICGSMRGYKTNVRKLTETYAGAVYNPDLPVVSVDSKGQLVFKAKGNGS